MIPNLVNFLKDSQTDIFWKFYLATIYFWGHLNNDTNSDDSDFKKCDSSFGKFPETLRLIVLEILPSNHIYLGSFKKLH